MNPMTTTDGRVRHGGARGAAERVAGLVAGLLAVMLPLALAPSASASAAYDITQVGDAEFVGVTDANGKELSGQTVASNGVQVTAVIRIVIDDMAKLGEGDVVKIGATAKAGSHFGPNLFSDTNLPATLLDRQGVAVFTVARTGSNSLRLTRTAAAAVGRYSCDLTVESKLWYSSPESESSTWMIGKASTYTFASRPLPNSPCTGNSAGRFDPETSNATIWINSWLVNCATMTALANGGDTSGFTKDSQVGWVRIVTDYGTIKTVSPTSYAAFVQKAVDGKTPGSRDDRQVQTFLPRADEDISTYEKAVANLPVGHIAYTVLDDGSWCLAYNVGSRLPGLDNSMKLPDAADATTLELQGNTGNIWQGAQVNFRIRFADETIPNRVTVETRSTEGALLTTTLTTVPVEPAEGQGQSAIKYDPNGGEGDSFKTVGNPGAEATTPEAATFTRNGHTFTGWNTKPDGSGTAYRPGDKIAYPAEGKVLTLYAQWTPITYTVRLDGNGATSGMMDDLTVAYDAEATLPAGRYAKDGKTFTGWNTKADGSGEAYGDGASVRNLTSAQGGVVVLYAQWADALTVLPETGGHAGHAPSAAGMAVTAAAIALAVLARRRATRHSI